MSLGTRGVILLIALSVPGVCSINTSVYTQLTGSVMDIPFWPPPPGLYGDFNPAPNSIQFHIGNTMSFTLNSTPRGPAPRALGTMSITGPPYLAPPVAVDPLNVHSADGWFRGGQNSVQVSDVYPAVTVMGAAMSHVLTGSVYFDNPSAYVNISFTTQSPAGVVTTSGNVFSIGAGLDAPFRLTGGVTTMYSQPTTITPSIVGTLEYKFFNGSGAIYFPGSLEMVLTDVPEPASYTLCAAPLLLIWSIRRMRA